MYIVKNSKKYITNKEIEIDCIDAKEILVRVGDTVQSDQGIFSIDRSIIVESHDVAQALGVNSYEVQNYIGRVAGQYIDKGDLLAERATTGGLVLKQLYANKSGVLSTDRISQGFIDICSEKYEEIVQTGFYGKVKSIEPGKKIVIEASANVIEFSTIAGKLLKTDQKDGYIGGTLKIVNEGDSVYSGSVIGEDYANCIVFAGRYLHPQLLSELERNGAKAVISIGGDYLEVKNASCPVVLIGGYGHMAYDLLSDIIELLSKSLYVQIDIENKQLQIALNKKEEKQSQNLHSNSLFAGFADEIKIDDTVISHDRESFGMSGKVVSILNSGVDFMIQRKDGGKFIVPGETLIILRN